MKIREALGLILFSAWLPAFQVEAQVNVQPQNYSMTVTTQTLQPEQIQVIDGIATVHYSQSSGKLNGSPYLTEVFVPGVMTILDGTRIDGLRYRYDIYKDEMQFILKEDTASINKPLALRSIEMENKKFVYEVYQVSDQMVSAGYFELLADGNLALLFRRELKLEYDNYVPNYGGGGGTKEFMLQNDDNYYVRLKGSAARKIYSKKDFLKSIPDHQEQVKKYIKENHISIRKQPELEALVSYYNSL